MLTTPGGSPRGCRRPSRPCRARRRSPWRSPGARPAPRCHRPWSSCRTRSAACSSRRRRAGPRSRCSSGRMDLYGSRWTAGGTAVSNNQWFARKGRKARLVVLEHDRRIKLGQATRSSGCPQWSVGPPAIASGARCARRSAAATAAHGSSRGGRTTWHATAESRAQQAEHGAGPAGRIPASGPRCFSRRALRAARVRRSDTVAASRDRALWKWLPGRDHDNLSLSRRTARGSTEPTVGQEGH